jgi:hypothetical protein
MNSKMSGSIVILCAMLTLPGMISAKGKSRRDILVSAWKPSITPIRQTSQTFLRQF